MNKYLKFTKNMAYSGLGFVFGGIAGSEITKHFTSSEAWISGAATLSEFVYGYTIMFGSHAKDNPDLYTDLEGKLLKRELAKDCIKLVGGVSILDYLYLTGRAYLQYYFQKNGYSPVDSSLLADAICVPLFVAAAIPIGRLVGVIRENNDKK
ncbi:MAG: hypothetical protein NT001_05585 [Candidatus Woesearchaeota archaeon]|nr:hypothetical protein [Candidatus Woesearchaeota archaeon]